MSRHPFLTISSRMPRKWNEFFLLIPMTKKRDVFEAKLWLTHVPELQPRPPSVYSCCNSAGIFPHSYGNVLGLIERSQLGFGVRRKWYTSKYLCSNGKPSITTELASHDINFTPNRAKNVLLPQASLSPAKDAREMRGWWVLCQAKTIKLSQSCSAKNRGMDEHKKMLKMSQMRRQK